MRFYIGLTFLTTAVLQYYYLTPTMHGFQESNRRSGVALADVITGFIQLRSQGRSERDGHPASRLRPLISTFSLRWMHRPTKVARGGTLVEADRYVDQRHDTANAMLSDFSSSSNSSSSEQCVAASCSCSRPDKRSASLHHPHSQRVQPASELAGWPAGRPASWNESFATQYGPRTPLLNCGRRRRRRRRR